MTLFFRTRPLLAAAVLFTTFAGTSVWAQDGTVYIGGSARPSGSTAAGTSVQVDMSVLDDIGGRPPIGQSLLPPPGGSLNGQRVTLSPPGSATARKPQAPRRTPAKANPAPRKAPAPAAKPTAAASLPDVSPAQIEPPPAPIDLATAMPPPLPEPKPPLSAVRAPEPARSAAPRDLKPTPSPAPLMAAMTSAEPVAPAPAPVPTPVITPATAAPAAIIAEPAVASAPTPPLATAPAPAAAAAPTPAAAAPAQVAALTPARPTGSGPQSLRIPFSGEAAVLPEPAKGELKQIAGALSKDPATRVQVMAYASGGDDGAKARRLSLSRALAVRTYLIEQGIGSTRIDVRALGNTAEGGPADRVDLVVVSR